MDAETEARVDAIRHFNRFYTRQIGVLNEGLLKSDLSLTEMRVLYEVGRRGDVSPAELGRDLSLDAGYLSRILRGFESRGMITRRTSDTDGRQSILSPTDLGRVAIAEYERRSREEIAAMLAEVPAADQRRLVKAMRAVEGILAPEPDKAATIVLRPHRPGDMGWVVQSHAVLYTTEYGWDDRFEAMVAEIVGRFLRDLDPKRERCWIAEKDGEPVGSVFLVRHSDEIAKLRLLLVDARARGLGIGRRLVQECIRFARLAGYRGITLWTNDPLTTARAIYEKEGFRLVKEERHAMFGPEMTGQTWDLEL